MSSSGYESIPLTPPDVDLLEGARKLQEIPLRIERLLGVRDVTLKNLYSLVEEIEISYDKSRKARIGGTVATVSGSVLSIVGFALTPVTFGASLGLGIAGGIIAAGGGTTIAGAEIGYYVVSKEKLKHANTACANDRKEMEELKNLGEEYAELVSSLAEKYDTTEDEMHERLKKTATEVYTVGKMAGRGVYYSYKLLDGFADIGRTVEKAITTAARAGQAGSRTAWAGLSTFGRVFGIVGVVFDTVFIPIDIAVMVKSAYDVHQYKKGKSNSNRAEEVRNLISQLEAHRDKLLAKRDDDQDV